MQDNVIEEAFEELAASGTIPSVRQVRARIGSGSMTQINAVVGKLKSEYLLRNSPQHEIPAVMREKCDRLASQMWSLLKTEADIEAEEVKRAFELRAEEVGVALAEAYVDADIAQKRIGELEAKCDDLGARLAVELEAQNALKLDLAVCRQRFSDLSVRASDLQRIVDNLTVRRVKPTNDGPADTGAVVFGRDGPLRASTLQAVAGLLAGHIGENGPVHEDRLVAEVAGLAEAPPKRLATAVGKLVDAGTLQRAETGELSLPTSEEKSDVEAD